MCIRDRTLVDADAAALAVGVVEVVALLVAPDHALGAVHQLSLIHI